MIIWIFSAQSYKILPSFTFFGPSRIIIFLEQEQSDSNQTHIVINIRLKSFSAQNHKSHHPTTNPSITQFAFCCQIEQPEYSSDVVNHRVYFTWIIDFNRRCCSVHHRPSLSCCDRPLTICACDGHSLNCPIQSTPPHPPIHPSWSSSDDGMMMLLV